jgi:NAD(P)-dependent dehydrogenase (short-subunit alcohol dehydrogenase family)
MQNISDAKAVITGGASGLGLGTAEYLVNAGASVALLDLQGESGRAAADSLGSRAHFQQCDVSSADNVRAAIAAASERLGGINLLVNCAGIAIGGRALGKSGPLPAEVFTRVITINLIGTFLCDQAAAEIMQRNSPDEDGQRGLIIHTSSILAFDGQIGSVAYAASKAGVAGMTLPLAREFAASGIRVVTIAPGMFTTPMVTVLPKEIQETMRSQVPFPNRPGKPAEFAMLVKSIFENPMLNGETIRLDGTARL